MFVTALHFSSFVSTYKCNHPYVHSPLFRFLDSVSSLQMWLPGLAVSVSCNSAMKRCAKKTLRIPIILSANSTYGMWLLYHSEIKLTLKKSELMPTHRKFKLPPYKFWNRFQLRTGCQYPKAHCCWEQLWKTLIIPDESRSLWTVSYYQSSYPLVALTD